MRKMYMPSLRQISLDGTNKGCATLLGSLILPQDIMTLSVTGQAGADDDLSRRWQAAEPYCRLSKMVLLQASSDACYGVYNVNSMGRFTPTTSPEITLVFEVDPSDAA
jgi:hypothetical protein